MPEIVTMSGDRSARITEWLAEKGPDLASMHRTAHQLLASTARPGDERVRVSLICHSMRELMKHLPEVIAGSGRNATGPRSDDYIRQLPGIASKYPGLDLSQDAENVPVPQEIARFLGDLIKASVSEDGRFLSSIAAFLTDDGNSKHPAVREWHRNYRRFVKWAHLHGSQSEVSSTPSDDELGSWIEMAEVQMDSVRAGFFDSLHAVEDLLAEANRPVDGCESDG